MTATVPDANGRRRWRDIVRRLLCTLGVVFLGLLAYDVAGSRIVGEERFCVHTARVTDPIAGDWTIQVEVADTGSGCFDDRAVCRRERIVLPDATRPC